MSREKLEVADVFRAHGQYWRESHAGHVSLAQLKVMSGIEHCRSEVLGGHALHCPACEHDLIAYNSCRNRHCAKCQASAAKRWLAARQTELLPVDYYHVVFTLPQPISELAYYNKSVMYGLLLKAAAKTLLTIGADIKHLGARLGVTFVLHTWGSAMTHHPHVHGIVPGGLSLDGENGARANQDFSYLCECYPVCFDGYTLKDYVKLMSKINYYSLVSVCLLMRKNPFWRDSITHVKWIG